MSYYFVMLGTKSLKSHMRSMIINRLLYDGYECWFIVVFGHVRGMAKQQTHHTVLLNLTLAIFSINLHYT